MILFFRHIQLFFTTPALTDILGKRVKVSLSKREVILTHFDII